jgi:hypothetical protein
MRVCEQNGSPEPQTTRRCNHDIPCKGRLFVDNQMRELRTKQPSKMTASFYQFHEIQPYYNISSRKRSLD